MYVVYTHDTDTHIIYTHIHKVYDHNAVNHPTEYTCMHALWEQGFILMLSLVQRLLQAAPHNAFYLAKCYSQFS